MEIIIYGRNDGTQRNEWGDTRPSRDFRYIRSRLGQERTVQVIQEWRRLREMARADSLTYLQQWRAQQQIESRDAVLSEAWAVGELTAEEDDREWISVPFKKSEGFHGTNEMPFGEWEGVKQELIRMLFDKRKARRSAQFTPSADQDEGGSWIS